MKAKDLDKRIISFLNKRGLETEAEINAFLEPDFSMLLNPFDLDGMKEAKDRIELAICNKEKIVIYGDYDCDGISACVILYKYFLSRGVVCDVYIPNRFDDGYGLSFDMIDEVLENSKPDLIITVDLGVTAVKEVEKIKEKGVDIIVTDHHEPSSELPNCILIDPKKTGQKYQFNGLCGAGVALKLVEALSGREEIKKYLDVCAVATIGDIVPLTSENRVIAKKGIEMLNGKNCSSCYKYMLKKLDLNNINATDITFKLVPKINASGRMSNAKKVFDFLIEEDFQKQEVMFADMMADNENRLNSINEGVLALEKEMENVNLSKENIILLVGNFHQGVLGILASRICHEYNRPAIIFTKTEDGSLKGSGRSVEDVDLHSALENIKQSLIRFGGHKMAIGVEVSEVNFETFRNLISAEISKQTNIKSFIIKEKYDIQIDENDINKNFINQIMALEPFGCKNEKPVLMLEAKKLSVSQMKDNNYRHFKVSTLHNKSMVAFSAEKHVEALKSGVKKHLILDLENNEFKGKVYPQAIFKSLHLKEVKLEEDKEREFELSLISKFKSEGVSSDKNVQFYELYDMVGLLNRIGASGFGTIVVVDSAVMARRVQDMLPKLKGYVVSHIPLKNGQNTILVSNRFGVNKEDFNGYNNIVFTRQIFKGEKDYFLTDKLIYLVKNRSSLDIKLDNSRNVNIMAYNLIKKYNHVIKANNIFEWLEKIQKIEGGISRAQLLFSTLAFCELGFVNIRYSPDFSIEVVENPPKKELSSSKFMSKIIAQRN